MQIDICNKCHPFFTGEVKFVDRQGRVDRFNKKVAAAQTQGLKNKKKAKQSDQEDAKSYREILRDQQSELRSQAAAK
jgi:large subunit ribosomal protein L31